MLLWEDGQQRRIDTRGEGDGEAETGNAPDGDPDDSEPAPGVYAAARPTRR
jgi:hypothetical protein